MADVVILHPRKGDDPTMRDAMAGKFFVAYGYFTGNDEPGKTTVELKIGDFSLASTNDKSAIFWHDRRDRGKHRWVAVVKVFDTSAAFDACTLTVTPTNGNAASVTVDVKSVTGVSTVVAEREYSNFFWYPPDSNNSPVSRNGFAAYGADATNNLVSGTLVNVNDPTIKFNGQPNHQPPPGWSMGFALPSTAPSGLYDLTITDGTPQNTETHRITVQ